MRLVVSSRSDVEHARRAARDLAMSLGFDKAEAEMAALAVSELATNLIRYADQGLITLSTTGGPAGDGIQIECEDHGPGISDVARALVDGFSTGGTMGSGLPAAKRLMDDFEISSEPSGTRIVARKWKRRP